MLRKYYKFYNIIEILLHQYYNNITPEGGGVIENLISNTQARQIARCIARDIHDYVMSHPEEYAVFINTYHGDFTSVSTVYAGADATNNINAPVNGAGS